MYSKTKVKIKKMYKKNYHIKTFMKFYFKINKKNSNFNTFESSKPNIFIQKNVNDIHLSLVA